MMADLPGRLPDVAKFALCVAYGCAYIITPILDFVKGMSPRSPVLEAAAAVLVVTLPITFVLGILLLYIYMTPPAAAPPPGAVRRVADLACALAFALLAAVVAFLLLVAVGTGSPAPSGLTPT